MPNKYTKIIAVGAGLIVLITTGGILYTSNLPKNSQNEQASIVSTSSQVLNNQNKFKDGSYSVAGDYSFGDKNEEMTVNLTVKNDLVESVSIVTKAKGKSGEYQRLFSNAISGEIKGKKLTESKVNKLSGASLTSVGFNRAVDEIINQAKI